MDEQPPRAIRAVEGLFDGPWESPPEAMHAPARPKRNMHGHTEDSPRPPHERVNGGTDHICDPMGDAGAAGPEVRVRGPVKVERQTGGPVVVARRGLTEAELADAQHLVDICNRFEGLDLALNLERAGSEAQHDTNQFLYREDGVLVGCATLWGRGEVEVCLTVHPDRRRRGIGTALLVAAREECRRRGHQTLLLVFEEASLSGKAFVDASGGQYRSAEHRMKLDLDRLAAFAPAEGPFRLDRANPEDAAVVAQIIATSFVRPEDRELRRVTQDLQKPTHRFFVARLNDEPIGALGIVAHNPRVWIVGFGILPEYRRQGYGRAMLAATVQMLCAEDHREIFLEVATDNHPALSLYRSSGFQETATYGFYDLEA